MTLASSVFRTTSLALVVIAAQIQAETATSDTLFDYAVANDSPAWQVINDDVMGGISTSRFEVSPDGYAVFSGDLSLENNGGFASVRSLPIKEDLRGTTAFILRVRGDGRPYNFMVRTGDGFRSPLWQSSFPTKKDEWEEHRVTISDFEPTFHGRVLDDVAPLTPTEIRSLGLLIADKKSGPFQLEISWIKAVQD